MVSVTILVKLTELEDSLNTRLERGMPETFVALEHTLLQRLQKCPEVAHVSVRDLTIEDMWRPK